MSNYYNNPNPTLMGPPKIPAMVGPPKPAFAAPIPSETPESSDTKEDLALPISHEVTLKGHRKAVCALALDPAGSRFLTGSNDYTILFWNFAGMDSRLSSFREIEPSEGHQINHISYSNTGDSFLVCVNSPRPKLYDREGVTIGEFVQGDQYLHDMNSTKGHVAPCIAALWHPSDRNLCITASHDSTIRIWDAEYIEIKHKQLIKARNARNLKVSIKSAAISSEGQLIGVGCEDGSLQAWDMKGPHLRPKFLNRTAHPAGSEISGLAFASPNTLLSRAGGSDELCFWDLRKFNTHVKKWSDLESIYTNTDVTVSPDGRFALTGTSTSPKGSDPGYACIFDLQNLSSEPVERIPAGPGVSVIRTLWHDRINQIMLGCSDSSVKMLYSPSHSQKGALMFVSRPAKRQKFDSYELQSEGHVITPHALPMFKEEVSQKLTKRQMSRARQDATTRRPDLPMSGPGKGGRIGASANQFLSQQFGDLEKRRRERQMDGREAFLRHGDVIDETTEAVSKAYMQTQPKKVYDYSYLEEEGNELPQEPSKKAKIEQNRF